MDDGEESSASTSLGHPVLTTTAAKPAILKQFLGSREKSGERHETRPTHA
jgi:hypothetical protein